MHQIHYLPAALPMQAIADCCRSLALNPGFAKAHSRQATLLAELGYHEDAAKALEAAAAAPGVSCAAHAGGGGSSSLGRLSHQPSCLLVISCQPATHAHPELTPSACPLAPCPCLCLACRPPPPSVASTSSG